MLHLFAHRLQHNFLKVALLAPYAVESICPLSPVYEMFLLADVLLVHVDAVEVNPVDTVIPGNGHLSVHFYPEEVVA